MTTKDYFSGVIGYEHIKIELKRIIDEIQNPEEYRKLGVRTTRGILLDGEPGVGKTTMAKSVINSCNRKCFTVKKDATSDNLVKAIKSTFDTAKREAPSIVFLDDLDKFANEDSYHRNSDEFITVQSCIDDCKDDEVLVIATANELDCLPDSLLRPGRFDKHITVANPTGSDAEKIVEFYLSKQKIALDVNYKDVSRFLDGHSCATLETVINEAGVYAAYERKSCVDMDDIIKAFLRLSYGAPDLLTEVDSEQLKITAVHEAGHVVVSEVLQPNSVTVATVKLHQTDSNGFTKINKRRRCSSDYEEETFEKLEQEIFVALAGKAAVEIMFGIPDVGCASDIGKANGLIEFLNQSVCAYDFKLFGVIDRWDDAYDVPSKPTVIQSKLAEYYMRTKKILIDNSEFLNTVATELIDHKTITFKEIEKIKSELQLKD